MLLCPLALNLLLFICLKVSLFMYNIGPSKNHVRLIIYIFICTSSSFSCTRPKWLGEKSNICWIWYLYLGHQSRCHLLPGAYLVDLNSQFSNWFIITNQSQFSKFVHHGKPITIFIFTTLVLVMSRRGCKFLFS